MTAIEWFLAFYFTFITGVFVGMVVGYFARGKVKPTADAEIIDHGETHEATVGPVQTKGYYPPLDPTQPAPRTYVSDEGDAEIVDRPDAKRLVELEEDETVRESKAAVAATLKQFPSVQEILAAKDKFIKGVSK